MKVTNRKAVRLAIKNSIDASLVGVGKVAQMCYAYQTAAFDGVIPGGSDVANVSIFVVTSAGSDRHEEGTPDLLPLQFIYINVHSFVLYEKEGEWTESQSEDSIDDMEAAFIEWWAANSDRREEKDPSWLLMTLVDKSDVTSAFIGGIEYRHEAFQLKLVIGNTE